MAYLRYNNPVYADGVSSPRKSISGDELPSSREITLAFHRGDDSEHPHLTTLMTFFSEFVFHDIAHTAQAAGHKGHRIRCCNFSDDLNHPECFPVFYKQTCMEYVRSCPAIRTGCTLGPREQINQVTSFLDGSTIYGSSVEEVRILRSFKNGQLLSQTVMNNGKKMELLSAQDNTQDCRSSGRTKCFRSGDIRVNENVGLTMMHTLWMREHNRIAQLLGEINSHWDDTKIFEEARSVVGAELQHIVYNELLPAILGEEVIDKYDLRLLKQGFYSGYDIDVNPGVDNAVASTVGAFMYSMMPSKLERYSRRLKMLGTKKMGDTFFDPSELYENHKFDEYLMGLLSQNAQKPDLVVSTDMTNSITKETKEDFDLVSMVIQQVSMKVIRIAVINFFMLYRVEIMV